MYVIFPLDDLLDLNSARGSKRGTASSAAQLGQKRHTVVQVSPSQPNQQLPGQLQPSQKQQQHPYQHHLPLPPSQQPTPSHKLKIEQQQQQQQQQQSLQQQQQQLKLQRTPTTYQKTPSKASSNTQSSPLSPQLPSSVPSSSSNSSHNSSLKQQAHKQQRPHFHPDVVVNQRQPSYSTSTETSSLSSTGAKTKTLLRPPPTEVKSVSNRFSWGGSPSGPLRETPVTRSTSFRSREELGVDRNISDLYIGDGRQFNSLRYKDPRESDVHPEARGGRTYPSASHSFRSHIVKSGSFRSFLDGSGPHRPHQVSVAESVRSQHPGESVKSQQVSAVESARCQQVTAVDRARPHHLPLVETTQPHQDLPPQAQDPRRPSAQRHSSSRSSHSSGSHKAPEVSPHSSSGSATTPGARGVSSLKSTGVSGRSRGHHKGVMAGEVTLRDLTHPSVNETLKIHSAVTFKLVKTVSDFTAQLSRLHEQHADEIQRLVETFRKKNSELRNERPCSSHIFHAWESLLQEVEIDSQVHADVAGTLNRRVSRPLIEKTFYRKIQSRKVFTHRESFDTILAKTEDMLKKCRRDYIESYHSHCRTQSNASLASYFDAHNAYVQQLHATNSMFQEYHNTTLPTLLQELEAAYLDVSSVVADCILQGADIMAAKALEQSRRYDSLCSHCRACDGRAELATLIRSLDPSVAQPVRPHHHRFAPPQHTQSPDAANGEPLGQDNSPPVPLKNELVFDRLAALSSRNRHESLKKEYSDLERQVTQLHETQETLLRIQQRSLESSAYNKANELQEDISMRRFDLRVAQVHLSAVKAQKELFASKEGGGAEGRERKMSNSSGGSMKTKWMKALKSLKASDPSSGKKNAREKEKEAAAMFESNHIFQEYTYKKITACDVCHQILRGHSRQGLKCRMCKTNVHTECQDQVGKCQPKSRLLRRQRSTSEIEAKQMEGGEDDTPSSPVHNRRLLTTRNMRMSSVELPDENEKSLSSASTSPCPSPVSKKPHRLLPTNLYVVLYNFTSRHPDELDLRAGYKVTVTDTSDPDWWQGKCLGRTGYFPSKYVTRLNGGEKPLQVTHNLQVNDGETGIKLLRDQIVIQIGEEVEGMVMIRNGDNQQGVCPLKYLQEA